MAMDDSPPALWFQQPLTTSRRRTPPIDPVFLIILIPILAMIFLFLLLPPILYHTSHILKPGYVKSTWDSLNIFLVLFAILCGLMARNKNDDVSYPDGFVAESGSSSNSSSVPSSGYFDVDAYYNNTSTRTTRENENLYPAIPFSSSSLRPDYQLPQRSKLEEHEENSNVKEISVDTFVVSSHIVPEQPLVQTPPPPPPQPSASSYKHSFKSVGKDKPRSYPPPPSPPPRVHRSHHKHKSLERKVSDATKEIATAISSIYNPSKRKNKRKLRNKSPETERILALPPPPPPPPPPSVFHNLFKKGSKHKRIHSVPAPPPPNSIFNNIFKSGGKSKRFQLQSQSQPPVPPSSIMNTLFKTGTHSKRYNYNNTTAIVPLKSKPEPQIGRSRSKGKPPRPTTKTSTSYNYYEKEEFVMNSGSQSPLIPMAPPPPPPFKVSDMLFEVRGDFVKIRSCHSSVCSSPDHDGVGVDLLHGGDTIGSGTGCGLICFPSPDVNAKADSFISRLKDEWRMENKT